MDSLVSQPVLDYVRTIAGESPWIGPADLQKTSSLPLFLRQHYELSRMDLFVESSFLPLKWPEIRIFTNGLRARCCHSKEQAFPRRCPSFVTDSCLRSE